MKKILIVKLCIMYSLYNKVYLPIILIEKISFKLHIDIYILSKNFSFNFSNSTIQSSAAYES